MSNNTQPLDILSLKINKCVGIKQYREVKRTMTEFDAKLQQKVNNKMQVDHRIK
ncbi:MAG TPA: hypothetical protein PLZ08_02130 [Bacillota bacterium]|jgi:hypothetical protein|nr:hypothetical protein [Bacillota bacterium]HOL09063.1 hypothetical protein [Bacillota bacterium]HPO96738.1 hypothetical protein [Bacillota bacterium]